jgi:hypothetical protein
MHCIIRALDGLTHACLNFAALLAAGVAWCCVGAVAGRCTGAAAAVVAPAAIRAAADARTTAAYRRRAPGVDPRLVLSDPNLMPAPS